MPPINIPQKPKAEEGVGEIRYLLVSETSEERSNERQKPRVSGERALRATLLDFGNIFCHARGSHAHGRIIQDRQKRERNLPRKNRLIMPRVKTLRTKYPVFIYERFDWKIRNKTLFVRFSFKIPPDIIFKPRVAIPKVSRKRIKKVGKKTMDNLVFHLGMIELLSYWKSTCSPTILIKAGLLNSEQIKWWQEVLFEGMGQFFYENKIKTGKRVANIVSKADGSEDYSGAVFKNSLNSKNILAALGGGKDSLAGLELLRKKPFNIAGFVLNPGPILTKVINKAGLKKIIAVRRIIDPVLPALNKKDFLNGHTPFSAYLAFLAALCAVIFDIKHLAFFNEKSSQEPNLVYNGRKINHQWSKTLEFEKMFRWYSKKYLAKNIEYFSPVRKYYELQIAQIFGKIKKYHDVFASCNNPFKIKKKAFRWCLACPKCLSTFILLSPFLTRRELKKIFGRDLFEGPALKNLLKRLIDEKGIKPFECVGTFKELRIALYLSYKQCKNSRGKMPYLLTFFGKSIMPAHPNIDNEAKRFLNAYLSPA